MISRDTSANVNRQSGRTHARRGRDWRDPRTVALGAVAIYLAISGIILLLGGHAWGLAFCHLIAAVVVYRVMSMRGGNVRDAIGLLPLFIAPLLYAEVPALIDATGAGMHDGLIQTVEMAIFGRQLSQAFAGALPFTWLSEVLHAGYVAYYAVIFVPALILFMRDKDRAFDETVAAATVTYLVCWLVFAVFPVAGPRYLWPAPESVPDGPMRRMALWILSAGSSKGAAFPSSHMAASVVQTLMAWRWQRRVAMVLAAITVLIGAGAVYGGFHYMIDILAGAAFGTIVALVALRVFREPVKTR